MKLLATLGCRRHRPGVRAPDAAPAREAPGHPRLSVCPVGAVGGSVWRNRSAGRPLPFNLTGQPAVSIPMGHTAGGLPLGAQLVAAYGREDLLLQIAAQLEAKDPWPHLPPV